MISFLRYCVLSLFSTLQQSSFFLVKPLANTLDSELTVCCAKYENVFFHQYRKFEKELCGLSPNFHIHVSVIDLHIPTIDLPIFLQEL